MGLSRVVKCFMILSFFWYSNGFAMDIVASKIEVSSPISLALVDETESEALIRAKNEFKELLPFYCSSGAGKILGVNILNKYLQAENPIQEMDYLVVEIEYECNPK